MENREEKRDEPVELIPPPGLSPVLVPALAVPLALQVMIPPPSIARGAMGPWGQLSRGGRRHTLDSKQYVWCGDHGQRDRPRPVKFPAVWVQGHHHASQGGDLFGS